MVEVTLAAATALRSLVRSAGVVGMPAVRVRRADGGYDLLIEDRMVAGDEINESRGIRFYVDDVTASRLGEAVLDLDGEDFVLKQVAP